VGSRLTFGITIVSTISITTSGCGSSVVCLLIVVVSCGGIVVGSSYICGVLGTGDLFSALLLSLTLGISRGGGHNTGIPSRRG